MAAGANNNQLKVAENKKGGHGGDGNINSCGHNQQSIKSGSGKNCGRGGGGGNGGGNGNGDGNSCKDTDGGEDDSNDDGSGRSSSGSGSGDGGGNGCGGALDNLLSVNDTTILLMIFPRRLTMLTPPQRQRRDERQRHVRRGRGWATAGEGGDGQ